MIRALLRSAGVLALGTALGHGLILLTTPWLARIYSPSEFGDLALLISISNIATALACLRYDLAIPAADGRFVRGLAKVAALSVLLIATLAGTAAFVAGKWFQLLPTRLTPEIVMCCVLGVGLFQLCAAGWLRQGAYFKVALMRASQGVGFVMIAAASITGLLWAQVLSFCSGLLALRMLRSASYSSGLFESAREYRKFPQLSLPGAALDVVGYSCCIWVIAASYGSDAAGHYSQIQRLIGAPMMLASMSLGQVLLKQTADMGADRTALRVHLGRVLLMLILLAAIGVLLLCAFGEPMFALILGEGWRVDRGFITLISVAIFVRACVSPLSMALVALQRFKAALIWQGSYFASAVLLMPLAGSVLDFDRFVLFYALHEMVFYFFYAVLIFRAIRV